MHVKKPRLGYGNPNDYVRLDTVDSRHLMMNTLCFSSKHGWVDRRHVVEIGGGFGNWARLNCEAYLMFGHLRQDGFRWTIYDLPFVSKLQAWYLESYKDYVRLRTKIADDDEPPSVVIGAHSLSELPMNLFVDYYKRVVLRTTNRFFYSTHNRLPDLQLVNQKLEMIYNDFDVVDAIISEQGNVTNYIFAPKVAHG